MRDSHEDRSTLQARILPVLALVGAVTLWGITFTIVKEAIAVVPPLHFVFYRFAIATLVLYLLLRRRLGPLPDPWGAPMLVSLALLSGFFFQTWGLMHTTPARAAFVTGLSVLMVPLVGWLTRSEVMRVGPLLGAMVASVGLWLLCTDSDFGTGDVIMLGCALSFTGHILFVQRALSRGATVFSLSLMQCGVVAVCTAPSLLLDAPRQEHFTTHTVLVILGMGTIATPAFICQIYAQRHLSAVQTAVILALEPGMAATFSVMMGAEPLTFGMATGILLLTAAMIVSEVRWSPDTVQREEAGLPCNAPPPKIEAAPQDPPPCARSS